MTDLGDSSDLLQRLDERECMANCSGPIHGLPDEDCQEAAALIRAQAAETERLQKKLDYEVNWRKQASKIAKAIARRDALEETLRVIAQFRDRSGFAKDAALKAIESRIRALIAAPEQSHDLQQQEPKP